MNNSFGNVSKEEPLKLHIVSLIVVPIIFLFNLLMLLVFLTNREFLKKSALLFGVAIGNLSVALGAIVSESYRLHLAITGQFYSPASVSDCLKTSIPFLNGIAYNLPGVILMAIGIERLMALGWPTWYHKKWSYIHNWYLLLACIALVMVNVLCQSLASLWIKPSIPIVAHCSYSSVFPQLGAVSFYSTVITGLVANACTLIAFRVGRRHFNRMSHHDQQNQANEAARRRYQKQLRISKAMLTMVGLDFVLVVIPNSIFALNYFVHITIPESVVLLFIYSYMADAVLNMVVQFVFNSDFKKASIEFLRLEKFCFTKTAVAEVSPPS